MRRGKFLKKIFQDCYECIIFGLTYQMSLCIIASVTENDVSDEQSVALMNIVH